MSNQIKNLLGDALANYAPLTDLVENRIGPVEEFEGEKCPYVTYWQDNDDTEQTHDGPGPSRVMVQIDSYAPTYTQVQSIADAVEGAFEAFEIIGVRIATQRGRKDSYDPATRRHVCMMDYEIWHTED